MIHYYYVFLLSSSFLFLFFFFNDTATTEIYTLSLHDALPIIGAAQRVEHYEMAGYGTVRAFAELLGETEHVSLLEETLNEEKEADQKLTQLAEEINASAEEAGSSVAESSRETSAGKNRT